MPPTTVPATGFTQEAFDAFLQSRNEPGWLSDLRREAWQTYCEKEVPSRNEEEWMRTDIRLFKLAKYGIPGEGTATEAAPSLLDQGIEVGGSTSTVNGVPIAGSQRTELAEQGVIFGNFFTKDAFTFNR